MKEIITEARIIAINNKDGEWIGNVCHNVETNEITLHSDKGYRLEVLPLMGTEEYNKIGQTDFTTVLSFEKEGCYKILGTKNEVNNTCSLNINFMKGAKDDPNRIPGIGSEDLLIILIDRFKKFQAGQFACDENAKVLSHLEGALKICEDRTNRRKAQGTEGTLKGN